MRVLPIRRGHSLVEVLLVISILSLLTAMAVPEMGKMLAAMRLRAGMLALCDGLRLTRDEAIRRNGRVVMCKSADGMQCIKTGDWSQGWIVFHDLNNSGSVDRLESVLYREPPLAGSLHLSGNTPVRSFISYTSLGKAKLLYAAFQAGAFTICTRSDRSTDAYKVSIGRPGHPRVEKIRVDRCS